MAKLPVLSGHDIVRLLERAGFVFVRQKGSHVSMRKGDHTTVIPLHDELAKGPLMGILRQCGLSKDDLLEILSSK